MKRYIFVVVIGLSQLCASQILSHPGDPERPTIRTDTELVAIDVVVTDHKGNRVSGLRSDDFIVLEDGKAKHVESFDSHVFESRIKDSSSPRVAVQGRESTQSANTQLVPPRLPESNSRSGLVIIFIDTLNTDLQDQQFAKKQVLKFVRESDERAFIGIFALAKELVTIQPPTTDKDKLLAAAEQIHPARLPLYTTEAERQQWAGRAKAEAGGPAPVRSSDRLADFEQWQRGRWTFGALESVVDSLSNYPGRKSILWLTGAVPMNVDVLSEQSRQRVGHDWVGDPGIEWVRFTEHLTKARVAIYPIDIRGQHVNGVDLSLASMESTGLLAGDPGGGKLMQDQAAQSLNETQTMRVLAERTGGRAFRSNDLDGAMQECLEDLNYYTVFIKPPKGEKEGTYHKLDVKVARADVRLQYRREYFHSSRSVVNSPIDALISATELAAADQQAIQFTTSLQLPREGRGPLRIKYLVKPINIAFREDAGARTTELKFLAVAYDRHGRKVQLTSDTLQAKIQGEEFKAISESGIPAIQELQLPPGEYTLRLGIVDEDSGALGTTTIRDVLIGKVK